MRVNRYCNFRIWKCDQERSREDHKILTPYKRNKAHVECKKKKVIPVIIYKGNRNHLKIIENIRKQHTGKARHQETTRNSQSGTTCILRKVLMYK